MLEVQENSDITYRLHDYGRLINGKARELHINQALDVIRVDLKNNVTSYKENAVLSDCEYFAVHNISVKDVKEISLNYTSFIIITEGEGYIESRYLKNMML